MAYPNLYPFKTRALNATSTTSNSNTMAVAVPARSKYIGAFFATSPGQSHTAATNTCEIMQNGSTILSSGTATAVATSTGNISTAIPITATVTPFLAQGDVLSVVLSSCVGGTVTFIVQEF